MRRLNSPRAYATTLAGSNLLTRRRFLQAGTSAVLGLALPRALASTPGNDVNCILLVLVGGPSQLDTWDPKPHAPADIRGPFRPIATSVPGTYLSELFPRMARLAHKYSLVRSLHHPVAVAHETGLQLIQTGRAFSPQMEHPHIGCVLGYLKGKRRQMPAHVLLPGPIRSTGGDLPCGQSAGFLGSEHDPCHDFFTSPQRKEGALDSDARYGATRFGQSCAQARRLIEQGARFVTVNMFDTVFDEPSWDTHGARPFSDFQNLAQDVAPIFDRAFSGLIEDLDERGMLKTTMVVAVGEFGRTPLINPHGGRDHHSGAWTMVIGGGPIQGGRIIGATDENGFAPTRRPVTTGELAATMYHGMGVDLKQQPVLSNQPTTLVDADARPIGELF